MITCPQGCVQFGAQVGKSCTVVFYRTGLPIYFFSNLCCTMCRLARKKQMATKADKHHQQTLISTKSRISNTYMLTKDVADNGLFYPYRKSYTARLTIKGNSWASRCIALQWFSRIGPTLVFRSQPWTMQCCTHVSRQALYPVQCRYTHVRTTNIRPTR